MLTGSSVCCKTLQSQETDDVDDAVDGDYTRNVPIPFADCIWQTDSIREQHKVHTNRYTYIQNDEVRQDKKT